jgi:hypothetical protein
MFVCILNMSIDVKVFNLVTWSQIPSVWLEQDFFIFYFQTLYVVQRMNVSDRLHILIIFMRRLNGLNGITGSSPNLLRPTPQRSTVHIHQL